MSTKRSRCRTPSRPEDRRGFTLIELVATMAMLLVAMTLTVQLIGWVAAGRRSDQRRTRAIQEVANVMERLTARDPSGLTPERVAALQLSPQARRALPGGELRVGVDAEQDGLRRVHVELRWRNRAGERDAQVRLTAWIAPQRRARP